MEEEIIAPGELLRRRYIPIEDVPEKLNVSVEKVQSLIKTNKIRYAEFVKPGCRLRTTHVDPVEICKVLNIKEVQSHE